MHLRNVTSPSCLLSFISQCNFSRAHKNVSFCSDALNPHLFCHSPPLHFRTLQQRGPCLKVKTLNLSAEFSFSIPLTSTHCFFSYSSSSQRSSTRRCALARCQTAALRRTSAPTIPTCTSI